jgi:hypothetical protein
MRNTYEHVASTLARYAAISRADQDAGRNANKAAEALTASGIRKENGRPYSGQDVRMWRVKDKSLTSAQRTSLMQAHYSLLGGES